MTIVTQQGWACPSSETTGQQPSPAAPPAQNSPSPLAVPALALPPRLRSDTESVSHPIPGSAPFQEKQVAPGTASQKATGSRSPAT